MPGTKQSGGRRTPTVKLANRGSWLAKTRTDEAHPENEIPEPPEKLEGYALELWERTTAQLFNLGLMAEVDRETLGQYCHLCAKFWETDDVGQLTKLRGEIRRLEGAFGLSPSDRAHIPVKKQEKQDKFLKKA
jgi:phage terminase small subunit